MSTTVTDDLRAQVVQLEAQLGNTQLELEACARGTHIKNTHISDIEARNAELRLHVSELEEELAAFQLSAVEQDQDQEKEKTSQSRIGRAQALMRKSLGVREVSQLSIALAKERQRNSELIDSHNDLLQCLAQLDLENSVLRSSIGALQLAIVDKQIIDECAKRNWKFYNYRKTSSPSAAK